MDTLSIREIIEQVDRGDAILTVGGVQMPEPPTDEPANPAPEQPEEA
jgi:hypothetical protein